MPLETIAINSFEENIIDDLNLKLWIEKLYDNSQEFTSGTEAVAFFEQTFKQGNQLYLGMFNGKPIASIGCFDDGETDKKRLQYVVVHPANRGRGISAKLIKQVTDLERKKGILTFIAGCSVIHRILVKYDLLA